MAHDDPIDEQAIAWAVRTGDPEFEDWEGFTQWLEHDPACAEAYDRVMADTTSAAEALPPVPRAVNDDDLPERKPRRWVGLAVGFAAVLAGFGVWQMRDQSYAIVTAPGEVRTFALSDGSEVVLAGDTRLLLSRDDARFAELEHGQALFTIRHDSSAPFRVEVGDNQLVDLGTVFEVKHTDRFIEVAVAEGAVAFNPSGQNVHLQPGEILWSATGDDGYRVAEIPTDQIGEWQDGRITFRDATLADVAADLSRATGREFTVEPGAAERRVSGSLLVDPVRRDPRAVGPLLDVSVRRSGDRWIVAGR